MGTKYTGIEKYIFTDTYNFFLKYKSMPNTDYAWELCVNDAKRIVNKYGRHPLVRSIIDGILTDLEMIVANKNINGIDYYGYEKLSGDFRNKEAFNSSPYSHKL